MFLLIGYLRANAERCQTHHIALAAPVAKFVVSLSADGRVTGQGDLASVLESDKSLQSSYSKELEALQKDEGRTGKVEGVEVTQKDAKAKGQLVVEEEVAIGHLGWSACSCPKPSACLF